MAKKKTTDAPNGEASGEAEAQPLTVTEIINEWCNDVGIRLSPGDVAKLADRLK